MVITSSGQLLLTINATAEANVGTSSKAVTLYTENTLLASGTHTLYIHNDQPFLSESGSAFLYIDGGLWPSHSIPLVMWNQPAISGINLFCLGGSRIQPKEWYFARRAGVNSDGYFSTDDGLTVYVNGS